MIAKEDCRLKWRETKNSIINFLRMDVNQKEIKPKQFKILRSQRIKFAAIRANGEVARTFFLFLRWLTL